MAEPPAVNLKAYIAARTGRADELRERARHLRDVGVDVVGSWLHSRPGLDPVADPEAASAAAALDLEEISAADAFVAITEGTDAREFGRGGRHVEFGAALALGKRMLVVGPMEHVFHAADGVQVCSDWSQATAVLAAWAEDR